MGSHVQSGGMACWWVGQQPHVLATCAPNRTARRHTLMGGAYKLTGATTTTTARCAWRRPPEPLPPPGARVCVLLLQGFGHSCSGIPLRVVCARALAAATFRPGMGRLDWTGSHLNLEAGTCSWRVPERCPVPSGVRPPVRRAPPHAPCAPHGCCHTARDPAGCGQKVPPHWSGGAASRVRGPPAHRGVGDARAACAWPEPGAPVQARLCARGSHAD